MFLLRAGCKVPFPEKLSEEYMLIENQIIANISADKIKDIMNHFIYIHEEPVFFILELPSKQDDEEEIRIIRSKRFGIKPMDPEEACVQMELLGHNFYVFFNAETEEVNVVYKRKGNTYGLIEPELD